MGSLTHRVLDELGVKVHPTARFNVTEYLEIGEGSQIGEGCVIEGRHIKIGREFYMGPHSTIGGGSRFERQSSLNVGHFFHMGEGSFVNTARPVTIGNEVGLGMGTKLFTHGAYLNGLHGFPVSFAPITIGDEVWLPGAIVNPGVTIGSRVVVGVNSLVTKDLPDGCMAAGSPAKIIKENEYPVPFEWDSLFHTRFKWWDDFWEEYPDQPAPSAVWTGRNLYLSESDTVFAPFDKWVAGEVTEQSERLRDVLRRYGVRFYSSPKNGRYEQWPSEIMNGG